MKLLLILTLLTTQYLFALITIVPVEIGAKKGVSGSATAGLDTARGNTDTDSYQASLRFNYDEGEDYVTWGEISGAYGKANGETNTNKAFLHLRYIHTLTQNQDLRYELFSQAQTDEFRLIKRRLLAGGGLRYRAFSKEQGTGYIGFGMLHEDIVYKAEEVDPDEDNERFNIYGAYNVEFGDESKFAYTLYYQPKLQNLGDNVIINRADLTIKIYKELFLRLSIAYANDSRPPKSVQKYDFTQKTLFLIKF